MSADWGEFYIKQKKRLSLPETWGKGKAQSVPA